MTIENEDQIAKLRKVGSLVARTLASMGKALEPGMTTRELDSYLGDTGASFAVPPSTQRIQRLCRDGRRAMWTGIGAAKPGRPLNDIGPSIETFAQKNGYSLVRNLASHCVGRSLHDETAEIPTSYEPRDRRRIPEGPVFTIEPFLSLGSD